MVIFPFSFFFFFLVIVTCTSPDVFEDLLTSAEQLSMTSGYYAIVHVNMGPRPASERVHKSDYFFKTLARTVLFVGHFIALPSRAQRAASPGPPGQKVGSSVQFRTLSRGAGKAIRSPPRVFQKCVQCFLRNKSRFLFWHISPVVTPSG